MLWMAIWWTTEVVPLGITALLPFALFPLLGIMNAKTIAPYYAHHVIFLFLGGFLVAFALEKWGLHERIAMKIIQKLGYSPKKILLGFMLSSYFLSMWMSNTATTLMLIAPALAVVKDLSKKFDVKAEHFDKGLLLGLAFAASIGGVATYVGTPTNIAFLNFYDGQFPGQAPSFVTWMAFALPVSAMVLFVTYLYLTKRYCKNFDDSVVPEKLNYTKPWTVEEKVVALTFTVVALLWFTRSAVNFGDFSFPGWGQFFTDNEGNMLVQDSTVVVVFAVLLFVIPSKDKKGSILEMPELKKVPYNILLLFGGGFALSKGVEISGLGKFLAEAIINNIHASPWVLLAVLVLFVILLTELSSNTATIMLLLPILFAIAVELSIDPLYLMIPTTIASSFAFMFPVATPPNTIIFESERIPAKEMLKTGVWVNVIGFIVLMLSSLTLGTIIFNY